MARQIRRISELPEATELTGDELLEIVQGGENHRVRVDELPGGAGAVQSVQGRTGDVVITADDVGLGNVDNTSDADKPISTAQQVALDGKVDKVAGKGLSTNDFTDPLRDKLIGLEGTHWRGTFVSVAALQAGVTDPAAGDYADVDSVGDDVVRYIWDATDDTWVAQSGAVAPITASQVKLLYESNPDTNAFTDAEKSKLGDVQPWATAPTPEQARDALGVTDEISNKLDASTASLEPAPGKIPLADGEGKIDLQWLGSDVVDKINSLSAYFIPTPTPTPDNFGDPLEGGFYTGMIWNCIALSSDSRSISLGRADFNVDTTDHLVYFGQMIEVRSISNPSNKFTGTVIGASIGRISLDVTEIGGSGTHSDWAVMSRFRVIAAPKAQGESAPMMLKFENTAMPPETQTLTEGWKATNAMVAAGSAEEYPAAHWARSLMINGYSDFYIPARDELELQWRNLKPEDVDNHDPDGLRPLSGINYRKDGAYGDVVRGRGLNLNSYPQGSTYTLTDPGQTAVVAFQTGGAEANAWGTIFWSSSEYSAATAWIQTWLASSPGSQSDNLKTTLRRVRAVRRSII